MPDVHADDRIGRRHLRYAKEPVVSLQQHCRIFDKHMNALEPDSAVGVIEPFGAPHKLWCQMRADEAVESRCLLARQRDQAETRHYGAFRQFELAAERPRLGGMELPPQ